MVILSGTPCMLYFEGVLCTYNFAAVTRVKNAFSRFATWFFDLPQGTIREIQEMYKWCRRSLLRDLWNSFSHDHFTLCFFTFFFFIFHDRWSYFIFHIYRNEFWNISIKCSSFKERHFDYINLMRQYEKKNGKNEMQLIFMLFEIIWIWINFV